ncbi:MAG TPA: hypothetical protein VLY45_02200, partial [Nitrospiria bacterium]|nr:hypothetical protein [Nitrospiria bacterium]
TQVIPLVCCGICRMNGEGFRDLIRRRYGTPGDRFSLVPGRQQEQDTPKPKEQLSLRYQIL